MKQLIKNGVCILPNKQCLKKDILIENDMITKIEENIQENVDELIDATNCYVSPGFIDIHTHCYPIGDLGLDPDILGIQRWTSTIVDAGTAGVGNFEDFYEHAIKKSKTRVFSLLNVSTQGLAAKHELNDMSKINEKKIYEVVKQYPDVIIGLKARASQSVVQDLDIEPIRKATEIAHSIHIPLMIHIGNYPPHLEDVLNCMDQGDIVTHAYHGKVGNILSNNETAIIKEAIDARKRGVLFDIGHGSASFSSKTYKCAMNLGFDCDLISSDLHRENYEGPVYSLIDVVSKIINCGEYFVDAIDKVTKVPARHFGLDKLGEIKVGNYGDIFVFKMREVEEEVVDSMGDKILLHTKIEPQCLIVSRGEKSGIYR
ncbi:amidohydrolase/deacetylase family metallohydrolase [Anaerorhabdus sp.]|uniref:amidohydrolase/deacetylase family metallohydrolase n=1 Tax=Anaerorhabdus sp. TaxID=1872524 RepID=UPI002FCBC008